MHLNVCKHNRLNMYKVLVKDKRRYMYNLLCHLLERINQTDHFDYVVMWKQSNLTK